MEKRRFAPRNKINSPSADSPCSEGSIHEVDIVDVNEDGDGIGRVEGLTVFVKGAVPGDRARIKIDKVKKKLAFGMAVAILTPSEWRVKPPCPVFTTCGGCTLQNLNYTKQLEIKTSVVESAIRRIGGITTGEICSCVGMEEPWRYRNKAMMPVGKGNIIGFYRQASHTVVNVQDCLLQHPVVGQVANVVRTFLDDSGATIYDDKTGEGLVRHLVVRSNYLEEVMVVLVINGSALDSNKEVADLVEGRLVAAIQQAVPAVKSIQLNFNNFRDSRIMGYDNRCLWGSEKMIDRICGFDFELSPGSFLQVNPLQTQRLYEKAFEYANLDGSETVFDLYSGIGTITLSMAGKCKRVIGVESVKEAVNDAKANAVRNGIENTAFYAGKAEEVILDLYKTGVKADIVVLDPPRTGCEPVVLETIIKLGPKRVVYVSCKPSTMARDIKILVENGYEFVEAQPVDLFPHSGHVECVVKLEKR